ncbi:hypothetical protein PVAND_014273 [Polypedilum vanderplanki]|uniref:Uncharacterized protein n=1 Tax=Polypedilum vanderplanki TaxID=319348 RepID=A0A9J6CSW6_POLVA|nr:hypothetical protein PVAND_014273 [Polypedilum vanderplanki]
MNKAIISIFVLLCATQMIDGQIFGGFIINLVGAIIGSTFNFLFGFSIRFSTALISFTDNIVLVVSQFLYMVLTGVHLTISQIVLKTNTTLSGLNNATSNLTSQLQNNSVNVSSHSSFLGSFIIGSLQDSTIDLSYSLLALVATLAGRRPPNPPLRAFFDDFLYPNPIFSCIPDTNNTSNSTNATISCQALTFISYANLHLNNLAKAANSYEKANKYLNANINSPNTTTIQNVTMQLNNLITAMNAYVNINIANGTLLATVNSTLGQNITNILDSTQNMIDSFQNATQNLVNTACSNSRKPLRELLDFADLSLMSFWHHRFFRRQSYRISMNGLLGFIFNAGSLMPQLSSAVTNITNVLNGYSNLKIPDYNNMGKNFVNILITFVSNMNSSSSAISTTLNTTINATESAKNQIILNATAVANSTLSNLTSAIISQNQTYPQCQNYLTNITDAFSNFTNDVQSCGAAADTDHNAQYVNVTSFIANLTAAFTYNTNVTSQCYSSYCIGNSASNSFSNAGTMCIQDATFYSTSGGLNVAGLWILPPIYSISPKGQKFVLCFNNIISNLTVISNSILSTASATLNTLQSNCNSITVNYQRCIQAKTAALIDHLNQIFANYTSCTQQTTTIATTTISSTNSSTTVSSTDSTTTASVTINNNNASTTVSSANSSTTAGSTNSSTTAGSTNSLTTTMSSTDSTTTASVTINNNNASTTVSSAISSTTAGSTNSLTTTMSSTDSTTTASVTINNTNPSTTASSNNLSTTVSSTDATTTTLSQITCDSATRARAAADCATKNGSFNAQTCECSVTTTIPPPTTI